jgi:hypothetical protein
VSSQAQVDVPFAAHVQLLRAFIGQRDAVVERIQGLLNAQQRPVHALQDHAWLGRQFEDCFFTPPVATREQAPLRGQLQQAHWAQGFRPREMPGIPNEMFDPADMMARAFSLWQQTRWPGRNGRLRFAHTLFNLYVVRCVTLLAMRMWDAGPGEAAARLAQIQGALDALWQSSPADQPVLVRDARWLVPVAQSPTTDELAPYFRVAEKIAGSLPEEDRLEIHKAAVVMAGGHLRSQLRHFNMQGTPLEDHGLLLNTRRSNALDCAMTIQGLVPVLDAYERAIAAGDAGQRAMLAGVICQGISPDPVLFVNRLELLSAYSMIEHLFVEAGSDGNAALTPMGRRHVDLVRAYAASMARLAPSLAQDCARIAPVPGAYSPYGVLFGFSSNLLEHMTMKALQPEAAHRFSLEDVFSDSAPDAEKLAWVSGWRRLPHISPEIQKLYAYPQQFAEAIFARVVAALQARVGGAGHQAGHLLLPVGGAKDAAVGVVPGELPVDYIFSSDPDAAASGKATARDEARLLAERNEGEFLVSFQGARGWTALSKDLLTDVLGNGRDAAVRGLPTPAVQTLRLLYPGLVS